MVIRPETADDRGLVGLLYRQAFVGNYEAELVDALRGAGEARIALVADQDGELIGHILFAAVGIRIDDRPVRGLALAEMAVHADQQGQGIGGRLVEGRSRGGAGAGGGCGGGAGPSDLLPAVRLQRRAGAAPAHAVSAAATPSWRCRSPTARWRGMPAW